nr:ribonuclease H-like domain-containing protein [Tanacetum cinerariifolium]
MLCSDNGGQETIWNKSVPKKVNVFIWRDLRGRLSVRVEIDRRGIGLDFVLCPSYSNSMETCAYSLITCDLAMGVWDKIFNLWKRLFGLPGITFGKKEMHVCSTIRLETMAKESAKNSATINVLAKFMARDQWQFRILQLQGQNIHMESLFTNVRTRDSSVSGSLGLKSHMEEEASSSTTNLEWFKLDDLLKMWILRSLCDSLQEQVVITPYRCKLIHDHRNRAGLTSKPNSSTPSSVGRHTCVNLVLSIWLFKHKFHADGTLSRYKARLITNGSSQQLGVDFDETFSSVVTPATIRMVFSVALSPLLQQIIDSLHSEFDMTDLGELTSFFGISAVCHPTRLFLSQREYTPQLLECAHMHTLSRSSSEAEYRGVANVVAETAWLRNMLRELHSPPLTATLVDCDNVSAIYMFANPV